MPTGKFQGSLGSIPGLSPPLPEGFQSKVVAPRNPKLTREEEMFVTLTPSAFLKEMSLTTEQKLASTHEMHPPRITQLLDMSETTHQKFSMVDLDQSLFQPFPSEIVFQNYTPCETYAVPLVLRNNDRVPRLVKVTQESSPYFKIISPNDVCNKVAPGMASTFHILFTPEENKDYFHELTCITEREKFVVPIRAIGARAILDFPDQLNFSTCPVKYNSQKTLLIRNIGNREARFQLDALSPFSVEPSVGTLGIGESMQVTVAFQPQQIGDHSEDLIIHYDTGEDIHMSVYGAAADINVRLDKNSLMIEKTFLSMANQRKVTISNRSDIIAHFQWKACAAQEEEDQQKLRYCSGLQTEEEAETNRFLAECGADHMMRERLSILSRTFHNRRTMVQGDDMLFSDNIFIIEPVEGDVWPNSSVDVNVLFKPQAAKVYQRTIYCDITGRETRLPLRIKGEGIGPKLHFNFDQLDIGKIFVSSQHSYEVILANQGSIDAIFTLIPSTTALGSSFTFDPNEGIILPGGHQAIQVSFSSTILGAFSEEFMFDVDGSPDPISFTIRGCVIGPTFHFSKSALHFGDVAFGFPYALKVCLHNTSLVPMTFNLRVPGDGTGEPSVMSCDQILEKDGSPWRKESQGCERPTEFSITPNSGTIRSQGLLEIQVTLCSNRVKRYESAMVVDVEGIGEEVLALPITARCLVPPLRLENPVLKFGRCFLQYPYQKTVKLVNDSDLPGCYGVLPQDLEEQALVMYSSPTPRGIIEPHSTEEIPLVVEAQVTGELNTKAYIAVFGRKESSLEVRLMCAGEGPVLHVSPDEVDFGGIPVLTDVSRTLRLSNQSFIPARFQAQMVRTRSQWRVEPSEGVVPPETEVVLTLVANLDDTVKFQDKVKLAVENSNVYTIPIQATGTGTSITTDRPFDPTLDLGPHFSAGPCRYHFTMMNRGRRSHQLYWMTEGFAQFRKRGQLPTASNIKIKNSSQNLDSPQPIFKLLPSRMELNPGQTVDVVLEGSCDSPKVVKERLICHAIIGKQSGKERIMSVDVTCEFIAPLLHLSAKQLSFCVEKLPGNDLIPKYEPLILKNISSLPLSIFLSLKEPFSICSMENEVKPADVQPTILEIGEEWELSIRFDPAYIDNLKSRVAEELLTIQYTEHPHKDYVALRGEVHFPNLHFQSTEIDFGCILNDTEVVRHIQMTNYSPLPVQYRWTFLMDDWESYIRFPPGVHKSSFRSLTAMALGSNEELQGAVDNAVLSEKIAPMMSPEETSIPQIEESPALGEALPVSSSQDLRKELPCGIDIFSSSPEFQEMPWIMDPLPQAEEQLITGVEEVFDILPLYGTLQPSDSQQLSFTFFGHSDISAQVKALCEVEGGPTYEITLRGEASLVSYELDIKEIDYGLQPFDQVAEAEFLLRNNGKVSFQFEVLNNIQATAENPPPGVPLILPSSGYIASGGEQLLNVYYFPGIPEVFRRTFQLQVAHLEPENITLKGEGIFSRICLDLPRDIKDKEEYQCLLNVTKDKLEKELQSEETLSRPRTMTSDLPLDESNASHDTLLQMELERLLVKEHALEHLELITAGSLEDAQRARRKLVKVTLPQYILDFGYVILGNVRTHIIKITNTCPFPVSFYADRKTLTDTGFSTELDRVKNLPYCETETFEVRFDPRGANLPLGDVEIVLPIQVVRGPLFQVRLHATVTMPTLSVSCEKLEFSDVQCGQCQVKTVLLHNQLPVLCEWATSSQEQTKQVDKHVPMHLRRKLRQDVKPPPQVFEMLPAYGTLLSGQKINVQVKFMPLEEKFYSQRLVLTISKSSQRVPLLVQGKGLEPRLDFIPTVVGLGPILPFSPGDAADVVVKNPCSFPIEFYSLELDKQYLEEEEILRMVKGYDSHNTLLLPPRQPGEKLPSELLEYSEEQKKIQEEQAKDREMDNLSHETGSKLEEEEHHLSSHVEKPEPSSTLHGVSTSNCDDGNSPRLVPKPNEGEDEIDKGLTAGEKTQIIGGDIVKAVGELDNNPVSRAIARHLGIDISGEGRAAKNRRGIAVIVHGAPLTGKTTVAISLAKYYSAAYLSIDTVILEAISDGSSPAGIQARELCSRAALEQAQREAEEKASQALEAAGGQQAQAAAGLSIEAVAKHTAEGNQISEPKTGPQSVISKGNRGSMAGRGVKSDSHPIQGQKQQTSDQSQAPSIPFPGAPIQRRISVSASVAGEAGLMSCVLPEELLVEILAERMQLSDCFQGIVFDGLESLFARNIPSALNCLLKAINNRRYIYMVNLNQEYIAMKAREKVKKKEEDLQTRQKMESEKARFEEMDEEEYDALSEEEKSNLDRQRLKILRERKREQEERTARELQEKKLQEELERQREEDEMKKKSRRGKKESAKEDTAGKKSHPGSKQTGSIGVPKSDARIESAVERRGSFRDRPESVSNEMDDSGKKRKSRDLKGFIPDLAQPTVLPAGSVGQEELEKDTLSDREKLLIQRFKNYETAQKELTHILTFWDRAQGILQHPATPDDSQQDGDDLIPERQATSVRKGRKDREKERLDRQEKERAEKERLEKEKVEKERMDKLKAMEGARVVIPQSSSTTMQGEEGACLKELDGKMEIGVPHIDLQVFGNEEANDKKVLESGRLPSVDEILDSLGLGPSGPPAPPPTMFSVFPYPMKRKHPSGNEILQHFAFIATSPGDPNVIVEEKKEPEPEPEPTVSIQVLKEEQVTPTKARGKKEKQEQGRESQKEKRRSATLRKSQQNIESRSPPPSAMTPLSDIDQSSLLGETIQAKLPRLTSFRWVVPPNGEVSMRIHFSSPAVGQFDQTLHFEIMGTRRRYQLYCRGVCAFPSISQDPKVMFPHRRKEVKPDEIVQKKFLMSSETFVFGPLLCGKTREKYKSGRFPENMEKINILNMSPMNAEIFFCFQYDTKAITFILDPPTMNLKPNEKQELCLWAYPTAPGIVEDNVVCCIKENPEPAIFKVSCQGVRPELELDRKQLHFDKILLHRKDTKTIFLRNTTPMAVAWRITGLENLGDDFSVSQDQGIISPHSEYGLMVHFKASRAVNVKKFIRLEVSDVENILGIVQIENIQIFAEAYDVALDISFPKGTDGGLDFGIVKVMDEAKLGVSLKNKGKYEIAFSFSLEATGHGMSNLSTLLSILPQKGTLAPNDRPTQVQIIFHSKKEVEIIEKPILRCQVIEPNLSEGGETIASIPIKVSARSHFTKYNIFPARDINFGAMILSTRKSCTFTLENHGEIEFKYTISKMIGEAQIQLPKKGATHGSKRARSREGSGSVKSTPFGKGKRNDSVQRETNATGQARFSLGMFTISPGFGAIPPGGHQSITVECLPDQAGKSEEFLAIDISDRDPEDHPNGIPYKLVAEACAPGFVTDDIASIFEEHRICQNMNLCQCLQPVECGGVYVEDENRFIFNNVLVGRQASARFKIINAGKVPSDVVLTVKPVSSKSTSRINEIFEVDPPRVSIPSHSHAFATVTFSPQTMQTYQCLFEAVAEGLASLLSKMRSLTFDITGDGNLPRVTVLRPILRNKQGNPLLLFNRLLLSSSQKLPLVLKNEGTIPAQLHIDLLDEHGVFSVKPRPETRCIYPTQDEEREVMAFGKGRRAHTASLILSPGESAEFDVLFKPSMALRLEARIHLAVVDNQYEESNVQVVGEGYQDDLTLDNIHSLVSPSSWENIEGQLEEDEVEATRMDHLQFGDCHIGRQYQATFTMTNRSQADVIRFEWPAEAALRFSPQVGHLHVGCAKDITVTLKSDVAITLSKAPVKCKLSRISFTVPADQVPDWDDRLRTVKWVDAGKSPTNQLPSKKKVIETDPEPAHTVYDGSTQELELRISATIDYAQFTCKVEKVQFKDTLLFQTRVYEFQLINSGNVQVKFSWQVVMEGYSKMVSFADGLVQSTPEGESQYGGETTSSQGHSSHAMSRPASVLESVTSLLFLGPDVLPFAMEPSSGFIPAGKKQDFLIKFSPLEVGEFEGRLVCSIPNLKGHQQGPVLAVKGRSIMPYCHFELEDSDYITQSRRNPEQRGPHGAPPGATLDPNTRVIEFSAVGVHTKNSRAFNILNPTNSAYSFLWTCDDSPSLKTPPAFRCLRERGQIDAEKKIEIIFEFTPQLLDITESFWTFTIPEQNIVVPFLLVGKTSDPSVFLDRSHLNFLSLLVGEEAQETVYLINNEKKGFSFSVRENSCQSEGHIQTLLVRPMEGIVPAHSRTPITIVFTPHKEGEANFNLMCDVKSKTQPLSLNVKADCYIMDVGVQCEESEAATTNLSMRTPNMINFKQVEINELATRPFHILNNGKFIFSFSCEVSAPKELHRYLKISPETGSVETGQRTLTTLTFNPSKKCILKEASLLIKISNGPVFSCSLQGSAVVPGLNFSFTKHDFGACFIYYAGMPTNHQTLVIKNKEDKEISLDCLYVNTAHLEVDFQAEVLPPGGKMDVLITFYPRAAVKYREIVQFEINGHFSQTIEILGQGSEMKIEVADHKQQVVNFGALGVGKSLKKVVPIVNHSTAPLTFSLAITPNLPVLQDLKVLSLSPSTELTLKPRGGTCKVEVTFSPKCRIPPFAEEVMLECAGMSRPLFVLRGCSQGIEVSLDVEHIPFGAVVLQSHSTRRVIMHNTGDIGARFEWDVKRFQPDCSISPTHGYITPSMEVAFDVTFHPKQLNQDIRYEGLECYIEGSKPLKLTLSGSCVGVPTTKEVVNFVCQVRGKQTQTILLSNKTNRSWSLHPVIEGEYWAGPDIIFVDSHQQNKPYEVTYKPLTMTSEGKKHQGSIFFPLPDGTGLQYLLQGTSEPPKSSGNIIREVPCKTSYMEVLRVNNWMNKAQRLRVTVEVLKPERLDSTTTLKGLDYLEVPAASKRDYKLTFFSHKEGMFYTKVTFRNESTQEYIFYMVTFKATPAGTISSIEMTTSVRQSTSATIKVENPLAVAVTFTTDCKVPEINLPPQFTVPAQSEGSLMFEFQPLKASEVTGRLTLQSTELGSFQYELILKATPAKPEKTLYFHTPLGSSQVLSAKFTNYTRQKAEYSCKIDNSDFHVEKVINAAPGSQGGTEVNVEVTYEPIQLGESRAVLSIFSPTGGEYTIPLIGSAVPPKPQGPFVIRAGSTSATTIPFKNVFLQTTTFSFNVDNPAFTVKPSESIRSKKVHFIPVSFDGNPSGSKAPLTGKLTISCPRATGIGQGIYWVMYLKVVTPEK